MGEMAHGNNALLQFHLWAGYIIMLPLALTLGAFITLTVRLWLALNAFQSMLVDGFKNLCAC